MVTVDRPYRNPEGDPHQKFNCHPLSAKALGWGGGVTQCEISAKKGAMVDHLNQDHPNAVLLGFHRV